MRKTAFLLATVVISALAGKATANDLSKIDRSLAKEPKYNHTPRYFLLVFGPEAKARLWCVFDGDDVLYVDRNGNGDLTDEGERFVLHEKDKHFLVGDITEKDGKTTHRNLRVSPPSSASEGRAAAVTIQVEIKGEYVMDTAIEINKAMARPQDAPFRHFHGPLSLCLVDKDNVKFVRGRRQQLLNIAIGTYYPECKEWVLISHEKGVQRDIHPVAEIAFPGKTSQAEPIVVKMPLFGRC